MSKKYPRIVTLIDRDYPNRAGVFRLLGEGPKNYKAAYIHDDGTQGYTSLYEKDKKSLIEGDHRALVNRLQKAETDYNTARQNYDSLHRQAVWDLDRQWQIENPPPDWPRPTDITAAYLAEIKDTAELRELSDRLFCGVFSTGISYADRATERAGDFRKLAFLSFGSLTLRIEPDCPAKFRPLIEADAASIQAKKGQEFKVSEAGQTVLLGGAA